MKRKGRGIKHYDVAIVGAGPAGSTCAYELGKAGKKVALFDHSHPREKPCGGLISLRTANLAFPKKLIEQKIDYVVLKSPDGTSVCIYHKNAGVIVARKKFDNFLLKRAAYVSKHFREKVLVIEKDLCGWIVKTEKRKVSADILLGADGCVSLVRRELIGSISKENLAHCVVYHILPSNSRICQKIGNAIELHFFNIKNSIGYYWVFPKKKYVNVGIGDKLGTANLRKKLDDFIRSDERLMATEKVAYSHLIPAISDPDFYKSKISGKDWALLGDAAGHVNPLTGEGIYFAMSDGKLAAETIMSGNLETYDRAWRTLFGSFFYLGARYQKIFFNQKLLNFIIKRAQKNENLQKYLFDILFAFKPYHEVITCKNIWRSILSTNRTNKHIPRLVY